MTPVDKRAADSPMEVLVYDLAAAIGLHPALDMVDLFGSQTLRVPPGFDPADPLTRLIGSGPTAALVGAYGGRLVRLPPRKWRPPEVRALRARGFTIPGIAAATALTERRVYQILAGAEDRL